MTERHRRLFAPQFPIAIAVALTLVVALTLAAGLTGCGDRLVSFDNSLRNTTAVAARLQKYVALSDTGRHERLEIVISFHMEESRTVAVERVELNGQDLPRVDRAEGIAYRKRESGAQVEHRYDRTPQTFAVWGANGIRSLRDSIVPPAVPVVLAPAPGEVVERDRDLVVRWAVDSARVPARGEDPPVIDVTIAMRRGGVDSHIEASFPDDGAFTIPAEVLERSDPGTIRIELKRSSHRSRRTTDHRPAYFDATSTAVLQVRLH